MESKGREECTAFRSFWENNLQASMLKIHGRGKSNESRNILYASPVLHPNLHFWLATTTKKISFNIVLLTSVILQPMSLSTYNIGFHITDVNSSI